MSRIFYFPLLLIGAFSVISNAANDKLNSSVVCQQEDLAIPVDECEALIDIYNSLLLESSTNYRWNSANPHVFWQGVAVHNRHVHWLILRTGGENVKIPDSIGNLTQLDLLKIIGDANISGGIPKTIKNLKNLTTLEIEGVGLDGNLPEEIGELTKLRWLRLNRNNLTGGIPQSWGNLTALESLSLNKNKLSGELQSDFLNNIPLRRLNLADNKFSGEIPGSIFNNNSLVYMSLSNNLFSGNIPSELMNLNEGAMVDLSNNKLSGELPSDIQKLAFKSIALSLEQNNISGEIPAYEPPAEVNRHSSSALLLTGNKLQGRIPENFLNTYKNIYLAHNSLTGPLPSDFSSINDAYHEVIDLSYNLIDGQIPKVHEGPNRLEELKLSHNRLSGGYVGLLSTEYGVVVNVDLSHNNLNAVLNKLHTPGVASLDVSHNQLSGSIREIDLWEADFSHNRISGNDIAILNRVPYRLNLSFNDFTGGIPKFDELCGSYHSGGRMDFSHNQFSGELLIESFEGCHSLDVDVSYNRLHGDLSALASEFRKKSSRFAFDGQNPYQIDANNTLDFHKLYGAGDSDHVYSISVPDGQKLVAVSGCNGSLSGTIFKVKGGQTACDLAAKFENCSSALDCLNDYGSVSGISNARIEAPASDSIVSGVVQFRGWLHEAEIRRYRSFDARNPRKAKLLIDGSEIPLDISFNRFDVAKEMGYSEENQIPVGWSALFYAGNLSNGLHTASLVSNEGAVVDTLSFNSFTLQDIDGKAAYISNNNTELIIEDFPYLGSDLITRFNRSEQSFSIIDQFNSAGASTRSGLIHYSEDELIPQDTGTINGVEQVKIETPNSESDLLGVASLRGWAYGSQLLNGPLYMSLDDGELFLLPRGERSDVEQAMGINTGIKLGWSQLFYAGNLENGRHRLRLYGDQGGNKVLLAESYFESFVPLDEQGKPIYIQADKTVELRDFPFDGSIVELRFDKAGQNFVPVSQLVY